MPVVRHDDPVAFLAAARSVIARDEAEGMMLQTRVRALQKSERQALVRIYLATVSSGRTRGAAFQLAMNPLSLGASDGAAGPAFAEDLAAELPRLQGVYGMHDPCEQFVRTWRTLTGRVHRLRFHLRHHILTAVSPVPLPSGAARVADARDVPWLVRCQNAFIAESGVPDSPADWALRFERGVTRGLYWIWDDAGPVAFAGWAPATPTAARVAPVYTLPALRGRGYATALVAALTQALLDSGMKRIALTTDLANPVSNAIYARIGFRPTSDGYHFDFVDPGSG